RISPFLIFAGGSGRIRMIAFAVEVFPAPVSPTRPKVLPRSTSKETPLTAWITWPSEVYSTTRSFTERKFLFLFDIDDHLLFLQLGIQRVTQAIAKHVKCQNRKHDKDTRESDHPGTG